MPIPSGNCVGIDGEFSKLRDIELKFRHLIELSHEVIYCLDNSGRINFCTPSITGLLGYSCEEVKGRHYKDFFTEKERAKADRIFQNTIELRERQKEYIVFNCVS